MSTSSKHGLIFCKFTTITAVDSEDGIIDGKAMDSIMEIGMLVKILQAGLIDEGVFIKAKEDVSKRYSIHHSFFGIKDMQKLICFSKNNIKIMSKLMNCEKKGTCHDCKCPKLIIKPCGRKSPFRRLPSLSCLHRKAF